MGKLFGTDGVRGIANKALTPSLAFKIGRAAGYVLAKDKKGRALVAKDTRLSGDLIEASLSAGLMSVGIDVDLLDIAPTPAVAYLTKNEDYLLGVQISASHNPFEYNGIKFFSSEGLKLPDEVEDEIEEIIDSNTSLYKNVTGRDIGRLNRVEDLIEKYTDHLKEIIGDLSGLKIALDIGNGALYKIAAPLIESLGAEVVAVNDRPDGTNINDNCGSTNPEIIEELVKSEKADIGMSFDGDADRIIAVDEKSNIVDGDHILAIAAKYLKDRGELKNNTCVGTVMSNIGLQNFLTEEGIDFVRTKVGDRYILEEMLKRDYVIGAEQSGHVIFIRHNTTGDGLATGLMLLKIMKDLNLPLSELNESFSSYPQVTINAKVREDLKNSYENFDEITQAIEELEKKYSTSGRILIRPSGTEPVVRVMIEGSGDIEEDANELAALISKVLN